MQHLEKLPSVEDPIDLFLVAEPYEEVGADLIAVLHRRNPKAMADAGRDFTVPVSIEDWNNPVPHMQLNPIRNLLWTQYFSHPENAPHTSKMVDIVFHVLAQAAIDHLENGPRNIPIPELNKRVAEKLRQALKRFEQ